MLILILQQHHMKPLQSNSFHILKAICMSGNCTSRICSPKKSKEKFLSAKKWSWSRKEKNPHNQFHSHSTQASSRLLRSNFILTQGEKKKKIHLSRLFLRCILEEGRRRKKKTPNHTTELAT